MLIYKYLCVCDPKTRWLRDPLIVLLSVRLHDSNNDTLLDGQEIMKALTHMMQPPELMPFEMQGKTAPDIAKLKKERYLQFMQGIVRE